jgi:hypothetical protein
MAQFQFGASVLPGFLNNRFRGIVAQSIDAFGKAGLLVVSPPRRFGGFPADAFRLADH